MSKEATLGLREDRFSRTGPLSSPVRVRIQKQTEGFRDKRVDTLPVHGRDSWLLPKVG